MLIKTVQSSSPNENSFASLTRYLLNLTEIQISASNRITVDELTNEKNFRKIVIRKRNYHEILKFSLETINCKHNVYALPYLCCPLYHHGFIQLIKHALFVQRSTCRGPTKIRDLYQFCSVWWQRLECSVSEGKNVI